MSLIWTNRIVLGTTDDRPAPNDPRLGASPDSQALFINTDTGDVDATDGQRWVKEGSIIGGGSSITGLSSDGQDPGGVQVAGALYAGGATPDPTFPILINDGQGNEILGYNLDNQQLYSPAIFTNGATVFNGAGQAVFEVEGTSGITTIADTGSTFHGTLRSTGGFAVFGQVAVAGQPVLAIGAGHTVDDVIALLQSYGFCKQS